MEKSLDGPIASVLRPNAHWLCLSRKYSCLWCLCSILLLLLLFIFIIFQTNAGNLFICFMRCSEPTLTWWFQWLAVFCSSSSPCCFFFLSVKARKGSAGHKRRLEAGGHGKCRLCPVHQSSPVCGSDGHSYSSKARVVFDLTHTHTPRLSHLRAFLSLSVFHFAVTGLWRRSQSPPSNTRAADEQFSGVIDGVNIWNCLLFSLSSSWQMRFKLSSSVTLSSSAPRPSPCPALPLIYWSQSPYAATNGVTYHEGFCQLGILSLCSLSTQSALFHQAGRRALQKRPRISAALHAEEEKRAHCPFFTEAPSSRTKQTESSTHEWQSPEKHSFDAVVLFRWPQLSPLLCFSPVITQQYRKEIAI